MEWQPGKTEVTDLRQTGFKHTDTLDYFTLKSLTVGFAQFQTIAYATNFYPPCMHNHLISVRYSRGSFLAEDEVLRRTV